VAWGSSSRVWIAAVTAHVLSWEQQQLVVALVEEV
jgi:hypothetical protein